MFLICLRNQPEGVYSIISEDGENVIFFFEEEDDALCYLNLLESNDTEKDLPNLDIIEVDLDIAAKVCEDKGYCYTVVTPNDVVVPPIDL
jgi:hypothetical protein